MQVVSCVCSGVCNCMTSKSSIYTLLPKSLPTFHVTICCYFNFYFLYPFFFWVQCILYIPIYMVTFTNLSSKKFLKLDHCFPFLLYEQVNNQNFCLSNKDTILIALSLSLSNIYIYIYIDQFIHTKIYLI
jgi:hypothetical protein